MDKTLNKILTRPTDTRPRIILKTSNGDVYDFYAKKVNSTISYILGETVTIVVDENSEVLKNGEEIPKEEK